MLQLSYAAAAAAMVVAAVYLFLRQRTFLTTTTMLMASLLLIYGPAFLSFTLTSGEDAFLLRWLRGAPREASGMWPRMASAVSDFDAAIAAMNFSVALMYVSIIAGIELARWLADKWTSRYPSAASDWSSQGLRDDAGDTRVLLGALLIIGLFMLFVSFSESHLATIKHFFASTDKDERYDLRMHHSGSSNYIYNVVLSAIAPMMVVWGALAGWLRRSWPLLAATLILLAAVLIGKIDTLSKAPPTFLLLQFMLAAFLMRTNRMTWRSVLVSACIVAAVIYLAVRIIMRVPDGLATVETSYARVFEAENESLLEYFAAVPQMHPFMWGANIRPLAALMHLPYQPSFNSLVHMWHPGADANYTNPSLFIADAWVDFSYAGVIVFSILAGTVCRTIDIVFLSRGKSVAAIAVLTATFWGIVVLLTTALNIALVSGGLLLAPVAAGLLVATNRRLVNRGENAKTGSA